MSLDTGAIRARLDAATDGPWEAITTGRAGGDHWYVTDAGESIAMIHASDGEDEDRRQPDAEFIAHAPEDIAGLLTEVERLRGLANDYAAGWAAAQTAQPSVEDVARVLGQNLRDTVGDCVCGDAYTERDLVDPNCGWHLAEGTADDDSARAVVALLPGTPVREVQAKAWDEGIAARRAQDEALALAEVDRDAPLPDALTNPYRADEEAGS